MLRVDYELIIYFYSQGGVFAWKEHTSLKRDREVRNTASEKEWALQTAEKFSQEEDWKAEKDWVLNA